METSFGNLVPARTDRALLVGQTGSGKTTLARYLLATREHVAIIDTKGMIRWPEYRVVERVALLSKIDPLREKRIIYRPNAKEVQDPGSIDTFFWWIYERRNCTLYVDETYGVLVKETLIPSGLTACVTRGRERGVEVWSGCQRPSRIPLMLLSESEHYYIFRLALREDRQRMEGLTGIPAEKFGELAKRQFLVYDFEDGERGPYILSLEGHNGSRIGQNPAATGAVSAGST